MSGPISVGYLQPDQSRVRPGSPEIRYGGRLLNDDHTAPNWHYLTDVTVEWTLDVDLDGMLKDCGLTAAARIGGLITWRSERTNLRGGGTITDLRSGNNQLALHLPGSDLGGVVAIEARVVLAATASEAEPLAPRRPGSLLWSTSDRIILEGSGGRFPTAVSDFDEAGLPGGGSGLWYVEITDSDLAASATRCLRLHLNSGHPDIRDMLEQPDNEPTVQLLRHLRHDTTRQLLGVALRNEEFDDRATYGRGTLGDVLITVIRVHFPGRSLDQLRSDFEMNAAEVDSELLASVWRSER